MKGSVRAMGVQEVRLHPKGAFHIGERGIGYEGASEFAPADTLFSAFCSVWSLLFGEIQMVSDLIPDGKPAWTPSFLISSAFPFAGSVRFYPKPMLPPPEETKRWKEVVWVAEKVLETWLQRGKVEHSNLVAIHDGTAILTNEEAEQIAHSLGVRTVEGLRFWAIQRTPRVTLDVPTHASSLFHFGRLNFREGCGLFFFVRFLRDDLVQKFYAAVRLMGDEGIGGDRTVGHGGFEACFSQDVPQFCQPKQSEKFVTLSPLFPKIDEVRSLLSGGSRYSLTVRSGWVGGILPTSYRRKTVRMLREGSVLCGSAEKVWGSIVNVAPDNFPHPVYRWGYAFSIACEVSSP